MIVWLILRLIAYCSTLGHCQVRGNDWSYTEFLVMLMILHWDIARCERHLRPVLHCTRDRSAVCTDARTWTLCFLKPFGFMQLTWTVPRLHWKKLCNSTRCERRLRLDCYTQLHLLSAQFFNRLHKCKDMKTLIIWGLPVLCKNFAESEAIQRKLYCFTK